MAFIKINDWEVSIAKGGEFRPHIIGTRNNSLDGTILRMRRGWKRRWTFETTPLDNDDAEGLLGVMSGRGEHWQYDNPWKSDNATVSTRFESTKGLVPTGTVSATVVPGYDLQTPYPARVYEQSSGEPESKFGGGALKVEPATENLLGANARDCESYTGFASKNGATLSDETTIRVQGSKSLKVVTPATPVSGFTTTAAITASKTYTFSGYFYATSAVNIRVRIWDGSSFFIVHDFTTTANAWVRIEDTGTAANTGTAAIDVVDNAGSGITFYCDMLQFENTDYATAWADGTRAAGILRYDLNPIPRALTVAMWAKAPSANPTADSYLFTLRGSSLTKSYILARRDSLTNNIKFFWATDSTAGDVVTYGTSPWDGDWHHVAFVFMPNSGGTTGFYIYFDGSLVASETSPINIPTLSDDGSDRLYIGTQSGSSHWIGALDEVLVLPFPMGADQISALANRTRALPPYPRLELTGDFEYSHLASRGTEAEGIGSPAAQYSGRVDSTGWKEYLRKITFDMQSTGDI